MCMLGTVVNIPRQEDCVYGPLEDKGTSIYQETKGFSVGVWTPDMLYFSFSLGGSD